MMKTCWILSCLQIPSSQVSSPSETLSRGRVQPVGSQYHGSIGVCTELIRLAAQIVAFFKEILFFVEMTDVEQRFLMSQKLPTVEEYRERRMGSSAVGICLAITE